jgi:hypothetical protein
MGHIMKRILQVLIVIAATLLLSPSALAGQQDSSSCKYLPETCGGGYMPWWESAPKDSHGRITSEQWHEGSPYITENPYLPKHEEDVCNERVHQKIIVVHVKSSRKKDKCKKLLTVAKTYITKRGKRTLGYSCKGKRVATCKNRSTTFTAKLARRKDDNSDVFTPSKLYKRCGIYVINNIPHSYFKENGTDCLSSAEHAGSMLSSGKCPVMRDGLLCGSRDDYIVVVNDQIKTPNNSYAMSNFIGIGHLPEKSIEQDISSALTIL